MLWRYRMSGLVYNACVLHSPWIMLGDGEGGRTWKVAVRAKMGEMVSDVGLRCLAVSSNMGQSSYISVCEMRRCSHWQTGSYPTDREVVNTHSPSSCRRQKIYLILIPPPDADYFSRQPGPWVLQHRSFSVHSACTLLSVAEGFAL